MEAPIIDPTPDTIDKIDASDNPALIALAIR